MNCQEFWNAMPQLPDAAGAGNHEHLADCPACAARLRSHLALKNGLRALAGQMSHVEAPVRVEAHLRSAFRAKARLGTRGVREVPARAAWMPVLTWATAAAALFTFALFLVRGRPELPPPAGARGAETAVAGMPAEAEGGTPVVESGFIPLPNAAQIDPNEEVNLVRVEVPRSAMIALGYDVKPEEASQSVQADVMLGNDGLARAVRFLD